MATVDKPQRLTANKQQELRSRSQFCERLAEFGWMAPPPTEDLGEDFIVHIYFEGRATGVNFHAQLKSVTNFKTRRQDGYVVYDFEVKDLKHWAGFDFPVVLVVWDVTLREGRWALVNDVIAELDQRRPQWRENKTTARAHIPWQNKTDDEGLIQLKADIGWHFYPLLAKNKQPEIKSLKLNYPDTAPGRSAGTAFKRFLAEGGQVTIEKEFIADLELSDWVMNWFADNNVTRIDFISRPAPESFPVGVKMVSPAGKTVSAPDIALQMTKGGNKIVTFSNELQSSPPLHFRLKLNKPEKNIVVSMRVNNWGYDVCATRQVMRFLRAVDQGGTLYFSFLSLKKTLDIQVLPPSEKYAALTPELLQVMDALCRIEDKTHCILSIEQEKFIEVRIVNHLTSIIEQGRSISRPQEIVVELEKKAVEVIFDIHRRHEKISLRIADQESFVELLGQRIRTGRRVQHVSGRVSMGVTELKKAIADLGPDERLPLKFVDVVLTEVFPDWFIDEAKRLSDLLAENFTVEAIYLFGSLVWSDIHTPKTDIDLAVSGLPPEQYFKAVGYLDRETGFPVDLIQLEKAPDHLRQRILTEGRLLYEQELALTFGG